MHSPAAGAFLLPNLVLVSVFLLLPLVLTVWYSMQKLGPLGGSQFLGINNYSDLLQDSVFWESLRNTAVFTIFTVPVGMALGLGIAVLLNGVLPGADAVPVDHLPAAGHLRRRRPACSATWMFDQYNGFVNKFLEAVGHRTRRTGSPTAPGRWTSLILVTLWQRIGFDMLIYLAGLQGVSPELLEAAEIDGASAWQRFRRITFPLLGPSTFFLLVMNLIYSFQVFDTVWAMTAAARTTRRRRSSRTPTGVASTSTAPVARLRRRHRHRHLPDHAAHHRGAVAAQPEPRPGRLRRCSLPPAAVGLSPEPCTAASQARPVLRAAPRLRRS